MKKQQIIAWGAVAVWMVLISLFSAQPGKESGALSGEFTRFFLNLIQTLLAGFQLDTENLHTFIRKTAHFLVYLILGALSANALRTSGMTGWRRFVYAFLISVFYAASDEFHQAFVPGRGPSGWDVTIDGSGALLGITLYQSVARREKRKMDREKMVLR